MKKCVSIIPKVCDGIANEQRFDSAVQELFQCGFLHGGKKGTAPEKLAPGAYSCSPGSIGWIGAARMLAEILPGVVIPSTAKTPTGLTWINGGRGPHGSLIEPALVDKVTTAQTLIKLLVPDAREKWTLGGNARQLFDYVGPPEEGRWHKHGTTDTGPDRLIAGIPFGYMHVAPGVYDHATYSDAKAYYFTMFGALPSLRPVVTSSGILWPEVPDGEEQRWREVLELIAAHKDLRNTLAGVAMGSYKKITCFSKTPNGSKSFLLPGKAGPRRSAGLLLMRTGYEITLESSRQTNTIYARIDGIIHLGDRPPVWEGYGFAVEQKAIGPAQICSLGCYKVGTYETKPYHGGQRSEKALMGASQPPRVNYSEWLTRPSRKGKHRV